MAIIIKIDVMLATRKMSVTELAEKVDIRMANLSILKSEKAKAIRLSTLDAIFRALDVSLPTFWNIKNNLQKSAYDLASAFLGRVGHNEAAVRLCIQEQRRQINASTSWEQASGFAGGD